MKASVAISRQKSTFSSDMSSAKTCCVALAILAATGCLYRAASGSGAGLGRSLPKRLTAERLPRAASSPGAAFRAGPRARRARAVPPVQVYPPLDRRPSAPARNPQGTPPLLHAIAAAGVRRRRDPRRRRLSQQPQMGDKDLLRLQLEHAHARIVLHVRDGPQYAPDRVLVRRVRLEPRLEPY